MLSKHDEVAIQYILDRGNNKEIVQELISRYGKLSYEHADELAVFILNLSAIKNTHRTGELRERYTALHNTIVTWKKPNSKASRKLKNTIFCSMAQVCKICFPDGCLSSLSSEKDKEYFTYFLELLNDPNIYNPEEDESWAISMGFLEYLQLVMERNPPLTKNNVS